VLFYVVHSVIDGAEKLHDKFLFVAPGQCIGETNVNNGSIVDMSLLLMFGDDNAALVHFQGALKLVPGNYGIAFPLHFDPGPSLADWPWKFEFDKEFLSAISRVALDFCILDPVMQCRVFGNGVKDFV
jgi:hypothetical protein